MKRINRELVCKSYSDGDTSLVFMDRISRTVPNSDITVDGAKREFIGRLDIQPKDAVVSSNDVSLDSNVISQMTIKMPGGC